MSMFDSIRAGVLTFPTPLEPHVEDLVRRILDPNPETRITLDEAKVQQWSCIACFVAD